MANKIKTRFGLVSADGEIRTAVDRAFFGMHKRGALEGATSSAQQTKKRLSLLSLLTTLVVALGLTFGSIPVPATAATEPASGTTVSVSSSSAEDSVKVSTVATADVKGKVNLEFIVAKGVKAKASKKYTCKVSKRGPTNKQLKNCKVLILKKGTKFVNSGRNRAGKVVYYQDVTKTTDKFVNKNGTWLRAKCGNYVKFYVQKIKVPTLKVTQVHLVKSFQNVSAKIAITAKAKATAKATAWCTTTGSSASASASASGEASVTIYVTAKARTSAKAEAKVTGNATLRTQVRSQALVKAKASASAKAKASASAKATCSTPTPVPPTPAPALLETDTVNDVVISNYRTITVTGTVPSGHTATLFASAKNGGNITANKTQTVSGKFTVQVTYKAPSEVPGANNGVAAGRDQVEFTLTMDDGQQAKRTTNQFVILARAVTPLAAHLL